MPIWRFQRQIWLCRLRATGTPFFLRDGWNNADHEFINRGRKARSHVSDDEAEVFQLGEDAADGAFGARGKAG